MFRTNYHLDKTEYQSSYYCGDFVYDGSLAIAYILTPNGQLTRNPTTGAYTTQYNIPDHLGNVRSVVSSSGTVLQSTDYHPFGLAFSDSNIASNRYLYNGKELEDYTLGTAYLGTLDYGARHYDPRIARWTVPDPMAEKYYGVNAYGYCSSEPINKREIDGLWYWSTNGNLVAEKGDDLQSLSDYLGITMESSASILERLNIDYSKGVGAGTTINKWDLWIENSSTDIPVVKNNLEALIQYYLGNGEMVDVGDKAANIIFKSAEFLFVYGLLESLTYNFDGYFTIDMTRRLFHIGHTNVRFDLSVGDNVNTIEFTTYNRDGFYDPRFISEAIGRKLKIDRLKSDGSGPNLETKWGNPYPYAERKRTYFIQPNKKDNVQ